MISTKEYGSLSSILGSAAAGSLSPSVELAPAASSLWMRVRAVTAGVLNYMNERDIVVWLFLEKKPPTKENSHVVTHVARIN